MSGEDVHALAGVYAVGALDDPAEVREFEAHLAHCEACADEVRQLQTTAAVLGQAAAVPAPPTLRARVLPGIGNVPQDPATSRAASPRAASPRATTPLTAVPPPGEPHLPAHSRTGSARRLALKWPRVATLATAACLAVAVAVGVVAVRDQQRLDQLTAANQAISAVLSAPGARATTARATGGGTVTLVSAPSRDRVLVASSGLPTLPNSKTYELWMMGPAGIRPAGLLRPDATGHVPLRVATVPGGANRVGLTVEPAGGSAQPTTAPIVVLPLT
jgi:anti-sigma-K factor RskA